MNILTIKKYIHINKALFILLASIFLLFFPRRAQYRTMIATGGVITGLAALKRQDSARSQQHVNLTTAPASEEKKPVRRRPRADVVIVRGKIRLYSPSGFFLVLGVLIAFLGIAMAILGYWPQKEQLLGSEDKLPVNETEVLRNQGSIFLRFFEQHVHSDKMKMLGPFTMGIGIFIFICANAILHENRDKETTHERHILHCNRYPHPEDQGTKAAEWCLCWLVGGRRTRAQWELMCITAGCKHGCTFLWLQE